MIVLWSFFILNSWLPVDDFEFRTEQFLPVSTLSLIQIISWEILNWLSVEHLKFKVKFSSLFIVPRVYIWAALPVVATGNWVRHKNAGAPCHLLCHRESEHPGEIWDTMSTIHIWKCHIYWFIYIYIYIRMFVYKAGQVHQIFSHYLSISRWYFKSFLQKIDAQFVSPPFTPLSWHW